MSFNSREISRTLGAPVECLLFIYGDGANDYFGYTSAEAALTVGGKTYDPVPLTRDAVVARGELDKSTMEFRTSAVVAAMNLFAQWPPSTVVLASLYQGHVGDAEFKLAWSGRIASVTDSNGEVTFQAEPILTSMGRVGLRLNWQRGCQYALYGSQCKANKAANTRTTTVSAVVSPEITLPAGWNGAFATTDFQGGEIRWQGADGRTHIRSVSKIVSSTIVRLNGKITDLAVGASISLSRACSHVMDGEKSCTSFNNIQNYGGEDWIPTDNPMGLKNNFY